MTARSFSIRGTRSAFIKPARTWTTGANPGTSSPQTSPWAYRSSRYSRRSCCNCWTRFWPRQPCAGIATTSECWAANSSTVVTTTTNLPRSTSGTPCAQRPACLEQRCALTTAPTFDHKPHDLPSRWVFLRRVSKNETKEDTSNLACGCDMGHEDP